MTNINATLFVQFLNFFIVVAILAKFAYKPLLKVMQDRTERIANDIASAKEAKQRAEELAAMYEAKIKEARQEAQAIIQKAQQQADREAADQKEALRQQLAHEKELARLEIENEREKAMKALQQEVVTLSVAIASKVVEKNLDDEANRAFIKSAIEKLDKQSIGQ